MPSAMPAELAERLSDLADQAFRFDPWIEEDVKACVPYDLATAIQELLCCKGCSIESYEAAREKLEKAMAERFKDI